MEEQLAAGFNNWRNAPDQKDHPDLKDEKLHYYRFGPFKVLVPMPQPFPYFDEDS